MNESTCQIKEQKHLEAVARNEKWAALSYESQLKHLDDMFGKDQGATKQRLKIHQKIKVRDAGSAKKK